MAKRYSVSWSYEAKIQVDHIIEYLQIEWGDKAVNDFLSLLLHFEITISHFPRSFKESAVFKGCRLGLVHKHTTAIYKITRREIIILTVLDNRSDTSKGKNK